MKQEPQRVLLVGKFSLDPTVYTYPSSFIDAFKAAGYEVHPFNLLPRYRFLPGWIENKLLNYRLLKTIKTIAPQLIFIIKGNSIFPATLKKIKAAFPQTSVLHFYPDNPFCFWNGNSNASVLHSLPYLDAFLIWSKELVPIIEAAGCKHALYFPFAVDEKIYHPRISLSAAEEKSFESDVVFVGTWDKEREYFLQQVVTALPTLKLAIWGNRWATSLPAASPLHAYFRGNAIYKEELLKAFAASKIVLNFIRPQNLQAHNMRTFEALAAGSFLLTQKTLEQTQPPFVPDYNITCFADSEDLIKKIAFYVNQDSLRKEIALRGYELIRGFTIGAQVRSLLDTQPLKGSRP